MNPQNAASGGTAGEPETTYGAILYLDGQRIPGKKTFRKETVFEGYKKGTGIYQDFTFIVPKPQPGSIQYPSPFTNAYRYLKSIQFNRYQNPASQKAETKHK